MTPIKILKSDHFGEGAFGTNSSYASEAEEAEDAREAWEEEEAEDVEGAEDEADSDFYESDYDCEDGGDDIFLENVHPSLNENNDTST